MNDWPSPAPEDRIATPSGLCVVNRCCEHPLAACMKRAPSIRPGSARLLDHKPRLGALMGERA